MVICILLLAFASTASTTAASTTYSSACPSLAPAADRPTDGDDAHSLVGSFQIYNTHFSGDAREDTIFSFEDDGLHNSYRSFSLFPDRAARTSDPALFHLVACTLELDGPRSHRRGRNHTNAPVSFFLDGYYSSASFELCMLGTSAATSGTDVVVLRLRVPNPPTLADPFATGTLQGSSELGTIQLLAYAQGDDYEYGRSGRAAACSPPVAPPLQGLGVGGDIPACAHLIDQLVTSYRLVAQDHHHGGSAPARLPRRMHVSQMHCTADGAVRAYVVFSNDTEWRAHDGFIVGEEVAVAEGRWDSARGMLCLRACRVARSAVLPSTLAVGECGIGMSFWFLSVWTVRDWSVVAGMLWNTCAGAGNDRPISGVNVVVSAFSVDDPAGHHRRNLSDVRYEYNDTMLEEARKHYLAINKEKKIRGSFPAPGNHYDTYHDFSLLSYGANASGSGEAYPVAIGSVMMGEDALAAADADSFSRHVVAGQLLSVSYDMHHYALLPDHHRSSHSRRLERQQIKAEGVYDPSRGILCMVGCREQDGSTPDCRVLVTVQLASMEQWGHGGGRGVISSLRDRTDRLFFEKMEIDLYGMYSQQLSEAVSRMDVETVMLVSSRTLSCVFAAVQILHTKRNPDAAAATSVTMLAVLAMGYLAPVVLSFEVMFASRRSRYRLADNHGNGWLELNQVMVNVPALVAFLLHLRLLQLVFSSGRRRSVADQSKPPVTTSEGTVLKICLPLYLLGAALAMIIHANKICAAIGGGAPATLREDLVSYTGLIVDGFLLPQVILNASGVVGAISPWFYMGGTAIRVMPHVYDVVRRHAYKQSLSQSGVYASAHGDLFGVEWDIVVPCGAALLASLLFWQQRLPVGGALW